MQYRITIIIIYSESSSKNVRRDKSTLFVKLKSSQGTQTLVEKLIPHHRDTTKKWNIILFFRYIKNIKLNNKYKKKSAYENRSCVTITIRSPTTNNQ